MSVFNSNNSFLGVDIGSTSIKVVELQKENGQPKLLSYGFSENIDTENAKWQKSDKLIAAIIKKICKKSKIKGTSTVSALPTFSVFSSVLNLSNVNKKEIASAVHWEAKKVIPLPLDEMILDWKEIKDKKESKNNNICVLLTGAPQTLVKKHIGVFKSAHMNLLSLETETFSLIRALIGNDRSTIMLVEVGANTTDVTIVDKSIPVLNRSIDVGGNTITTAIKNNLNIDFESAEQFKYDLGINSIGSTNNETLKVITDTISPIVNEIKYAMSIFQDKNNKKTEKIILSGGSALLPGLPNYLTKVLNIKVIIGDPWSRVVSQDDLRPLLNEIGPRMSVAVGLAMREMY
jgi:type IV pilus assembly protein PilM